MLTIGTKLLFKESEKYPYVIQFVVAKDDKGQTNSVNQNYDPTYICSTDRISPLWHIV
jgi:hypothetical protein